MSNVIKFQAHFERLKSYDIPPEVRLFKAIITQAIIDATNISNCREAKRLELEAKNWLFGGSEYFKQVCINAGMEPSFVTRITKQLIKLHSLQSYKKATKLYKKKINNIKYFIKNYLNFFN